MTSGPADRWRRLAGATGATYWIALAVMFLGLALVIYRHTLAFPLSSDAGFLTHQNSFMRDPTGLARIWTADFFEGAITHGVPYISGYYRPITNALFWFEYRIAGSDAFLYHLTQVLLHGVNALLVVALCRRIRADRLAAAIAGLLFVVHPVHAFAAGEPAARADVLFPAFYILAIIVFDMGLREERRAAATWKIGLTVLLYLLAVLSKEMGITLPAVLVLLALYRHFGDGVPLARMVRTIPVWLAFVGYLVWRFGVLRLAAPTLGYDQEHSSPLLIVAALKGVAIQLSRIILPLDAEYPDLNPGLVAWVESPLTDPLTYAALLVVVALGGMALAWKWNRWLAFWSGFFVVTYSPLMRVDNIAGSLDRNVVLTQERWIYLPSVAVLVLLGSGFAHLARMRLTRPTRMVLAVSAAMLVGFLGRSAALHAGRHEDPFARLRQLYLLPEDRLSRMQRANILLLYAQYVAVPLGELADAEARTREATRLIPDSPLSAAALGNVLMQAQKWSDIVDVLEPWANLSFEQLQQHHETNPRVGDDINRVNPLISYLLGRAYANLGQEQRAKTFLCEAARKDFDEDRIAEAVREASALKQPGGADQVEWTVPLSAATCDN